MSLTVNVKEKADLIWAIADKLTGVYKPHEYGNVILPFVDRFPKDLKLYSIMTTKPTETQTA